MNAPSKTHVLTLFAIGVGIVLILSGCATHQERLRLQRIEETFDQGAALIDRLGVKPRQSLFSRGEFARVTDVDGEPIITHPDWFEVIQDPISLSPGRHVIHIKFERESWVCGYLGCLYFTQAVKAIQLVAEPGHFYVPYATKRCDKDWIWIEDEGERAREYLEAVKSRLGHWRSAPLPGFFSDSSGGFRHEASHIVAGEAPPAECDARQQ